MTPQEIIPDMIKAGLMALIGSRVVKSIGEKEIGQIINYTGWCAIGGGAVSVINSCVTKFNETLGGIFKVLEKVDAISNGLIQPGSWLDKIINFGGFKP